MKSERVSKASEALSRIGARMRKITDLAEQEDRGLTAEERTEWENARSDYESREQLLKQMEYEDSRQAEMDETIERHMTDGAGNPISMRGAASGEQTDTRFEDPRLDREQADRSQKVVRILGKDVPSRYGRSARRVEHPDLPMAWDAYLRYGERALTPEDSQLIADRFQRAQGVGVDADGGYTVPEGFSNQLEQALAAYGGIRSVATVFQTSTGNNLPWPTVNDTSNTGALITEHGVDTELPMTFAEIAFGAYTYTSRIVRVSQELLQDSAFDLQALIVRLFAERLGRITATHYATGTGSSQPNGLVTAATVGVTAASITAVTWNELLDLEHSVDAAYREQGQARFVFNDTTFKELKQMVDGNSRPLWQPAVGSGADAVPATIDGYPYTLDHGIADIGSLARSIVFGAIGKYMIRDVRGFTMVVLRELYATQRQVGYNAFMRTDADLLDAGTNPVKCLDHPTS